MSERVLILIGSKSDEPIAQKCKDKLFEYEIESRLEVASAHRDPELVDELVKNTTADVIIAMAGLSAALPGAVAAKTIKPVIGVPIDAKLGGMDALLSTVQLPPGVPVAAVGIDNAKNAAFLAMRILGLKYEDVAKRLKPAMK